MPVSDWADAFFGRHVERLPRADWPEPGEFWDTFQAALVRNGVTEAVADEASRLLVESPPSYLDRHVEGFLAAVRTVWAMAEVAAEAPDTREAAELAARGCDDCGHTGLAVRFRRQSRGSADARGRLVLDAVVFYCRCPLGRWVERNHRERNQEIRRRIHDLERYPALWGPEYRECPAGPPPPPPEPAPRRDRMPHLDAPAPTVGEVAGRYVRRNPGGTVEEAPIY